MHRLILELVKSSQVDPFFSRDLIDSCTIDPGFVRVNNSDLGIKLKQFLVRMVSKYYEHRFLAAGTKYQLVASFCFQSIKSCCVFQPAFRCCLHLKQQRTVVYTNYFPKFPPFLLHSFTCQGSPFEKLPALTDVSI